MQQVILDGGRKKKTALRDNMGIVRNFENSVLDNVL